MLIFLTIIIILIIYIFIKNKLKNENENEPLDRLYKDDENNNKISESFIWYIISFIPYFILILTCLSGIGFGFSAAGGTSTVHGMEALILGIMAFSIGIPIFPILLIFQIIYSLKKYKTFTKKQKNITKVIIFLLITLLLILFLIY